MVCVCVCVTAWVAVSDAQHAKSVSLASWPGWRSSIWEPHCCQRDGKSCWRCWIWCETYGKYRASTVLLESTLFICHVMVSCLAWLGLSGLAHLVLAWLGLAWVGLGTGCCICICDLNQKLVWSHHTKCIVCCMPWPSEMCTVNDVLHSTLLHHDSQNWKLMRYAVHMSHTHLKQALWMSFHASISMLLCAAKTSHHGSHWGRLATDFAKCSTCSGLFPTLWCKITSTVSYNLQMSTVLSSHLSSSEEEMYFCLELKKKRHWHPAW